jgi:hypothetical protein
VPALVGSSMLVGAMALIAIARRWMRRCALSLETEADAQSFVDEYDGKLDQELRRL